MRSGHTDSGLNGIHRGTPILLMLLSSIILITFTHLFRDRLMRWGFTLQSKTIKVDEDLPNFFKTITL
jgi:hypothetical protein